MACSESCSETGLRPCHPVRGTRQFSVLSPKYEVFCWDQNGRPVERLGISGCGRFGEASRRRIAFTDVERACCASSPTGPYLQEDLKLLPSSAPANPGEFPMWAGSWRQ